MIATTRAALIRGEGTDALGDPTDEGAVAVTGWGDFPAAITERTRTVYDQAASTFRTVREYVGRIPANVPYQSGDRIRDNVDGRIYTVDEIETTRRSVSGRSSVSLSLRRTG